MMAVVEYSNPEALPQAPVVSVYMLTYGHEQFIAEAIEGVLSQQCTFPIELIIGEDCSPDNTRGIVLSYQKRHPEIIRVLTSSTNVGTNLNAERCIRAANGKYIAICEGDDYWHHPKKLQIQIDAMRADSSISLCHTDFNRRIGARVSQSIYSRNRPINLADGDHAYRYLLTQWSVVTATSVYRADVLKRFNASQFNRPDWPFGDHNKALFASINGNVHYIPISTATWRKVAGSAGNSGLDKKVRHAAAVVDCREEFLKTHPLPEGANKIILEKSYRKLMRDAFIVSDNELHERCMTRLQEHGCAAPIVRYHLERVIMKAKAPHVIFRKIYSLYEVFNRNKPT